MYELLNINPKLTTSFFKTIDTALKKKHWESILLVALKKAVHTLAPTIPFYLLQNNMQKTFQLIHQRRELNIHTRNFIDEQEAIEVWHNTYDEMIEELSISNNVEDKLNLNLIDYIYELLEYDQVTIIDGEKYLASYINLSYWGWKHYTALEERELIEKAKRDEKNIDVATNNGKTVKDRTKFLKPKFELDIAHPLVDSEEIEFQSVVVEAYCENSKIMARCIHSCSELSKDKEKQFEINTIGKMQPYLNSDESIPKMRIYKSWYAYVVKIYNLSSNNTIPVNKVLKVAQLSSYYLFEGLRNKNILLISKDTAKNEIRERSFFNGLRLLEFTDKRFKIVRSHEEIQDTELFLKIFTDTLKPLSKSSTSKTT